MTQIKLVDFPIAGGGYWSALAGGKLSERVSRDSSLEVPSGDYRFVIFAAWANESTDVAKTEGWLTNVTLDEGVTYLYSFEGNTLVVETTPPVTPEKQALRGFLPMAPRKGPPLPSFLNVYWPWYDSTQEVV